MLNRRKFLHRITQGGIGALALQQGLMSASARKLSKVGVQLYTLRNELQKDFEGVIGKVAAIGYQQLEFAGYYNRKPEQIKALLTQHKLEAPSAHVAINQLRDNLDEAVATAQTVGHKLVICPYLVPNERKTLADYKNHAATLNQAAAAFKKVGIEFGYHNHDFEFMPLEGKVPMDLLLAETDPKLVKLELDLYWITAAKQDPLAFIAKHPGRIVAFHVKDMDKEKVHFTEVGRGRIDFKPIFAKSKEAGVKYFFVEQDQCPGNPLDSIKISFDHLKSLEY